MHTDNRYRIILADPPWQYADKLNHHGGGAGSHYEEIGASELARLPVGDVLAHPDSYLFLWCTWPQMAEGLQVMKGWGFEYKTTAFMWLKCSQKKRKPCGCLSPRMGQGRYTRLSSEFVMLGRRKGGGYWRNSASVRQEVIAPLGRHSAKPPVVRNRIVALLGDLPRLELFARDQADGWDATGLELDGVDIRTLHGAGMPLFDAEEVTS